MKFDNSIDYDNGVKIPKELEKFRVAPQGSVLLCIEGGSAGRKIGILNHDVCFGNKLACFKTFNENNNFLFYYLQSPNFKEIFKSKKTGIIGGVGITKLRNVLMPIPPSNEQKRIMIKLQEIFPKINEYRVNEEKLNKLNSEFPDKLKSSILQEAIQGKLVPQDSNDEPASVLLENIMEEKERLIKEKKIKRNKNESYIFKEINESLNLKKVRKYNRFRSHMLRKFHASALYNHKNGLSLEEIDALQEEEKIIHILLILWRIQLN